MWASLLEKERLQVVRSALGQRCVAGLVVLQSPSDSGELHSLRALSMVIVAVGAVRQGQGPRTDPRSRAGHMSASTLAGGTVHIGKAKVKLMFGNHCFVCRTIDCRHCMVVGDSCPGANLGLIHCLEPSQNVDSAVRPTMECHSGQLKGTDSDRASRCRCSDLAAALGQMARD